jgi:hypothetical protein
MRQLIMIIVGLLLVPEVASANDNGKLVGTWRLVSFETEFRDSGERRPDFGKNPVGYVIFTDQGRMMGLIEAEGRPLPKTDEEARKSIPDNRCILWHLSARR